MNRHTTLRPLGSAGRCTAARALRTLGWLAVALCGLIGVFFLYSLAQMRTAGDMKALGLLLEITISGLQSVLGLAVLPLFGLAALLDVLHRGAHRTYLLDNEEAQS